MAGTAENGATTRKHIEAMNQQSRRQNEMRTRTTEGMGHKQVYLEYVPRRCLVAGRVNRVSPAGLRPPPVNQPEIKNPDVGQTYRTLETAATPPRVEVESSLASRKCRRRVMPGPSHIPYMGNWPIVFTSALAGSRGHGTHGKDGCSKPSNASTGVRHLSKECWSCGKERHGRGVTPQTTLTQTW